MKATKKFESMIEYENWADQFENCSDYEEYPVLIDNGFEIRCDMFTACKSWKIALKRFGKAFGDYDEGLLEWIEAMKECCENGALKARMVGIRLGA